MSNYDDYITGTDKPFAENINDALLLSNVFDLTVPIQAPTMFKNGAWIDTVSRRKCGVAILTLKEQLPSGVSISTVDGKSVLTGTGTVKLGFYPNFNSFGRFKSISWEDIGTVQVNLKTVNNTTILSNIPKGIIENPSGELRKLQEIVIEIILNNSTLKTIDIVMENKQQTRYGAEVGISDVTGLQDNLDAKVNVSDIVDALNSTATNKPLSANQGKSLSNSISSLSRSKVDKVSGKGLSTNDFNNDYKNKLNNLNSSYNEFKIRDTVKQKLINIKNGGITWYILKLENYTAKSITSLSAETNIINYFPKNLTGGEITNPTIWIHAPPNTVTFLNAQITDGTRYYGLYSNSGSDVNLGSAIYVGLIIE